MDISVRRKAFLELGETLGILLRHYRSKEALNESLKSEAAIFDQVITKSTLTNPWFIEESIFHALDVVVNDLKEENLDKCLSNLKHKKDTRIKIATILSGNKPVYGFLEMFAVLISGNYFIGKLTADDNHLLRYLGDLLIRIEPQFKDRIVFLEGQLKNFEGVIANDYKVSPQYLYKYFNKYPHIIHRRKYTAAIILKGDNFDTYSEFARDIFMYFGRTIYNVSKIYLPRNFDVAPFFKALEKYRYVSNYSHYANQYEYYKSIFLLNRVEHLDNGFLLLRNSQDFAAPVGTINFEFYDSVSQALSRLENNFYKLEAIAGTGFEHPLRVNPGEATNKRLCKKTRFVSTITFLGNIENIL